MSERTSGLGFVLRNYPAIVRGGMSLVVEDPKLPALRVDPDGERKADERRARMRRPIGSLGAAPAAKAAPGVRTIHLQWRDAAGGPAWRDVRIDIDVAAARIRDPEGWLLGNVRHGSGAIGVVLFAAPALLVLSPYLAAKSAYWRSRERRAGMSRHGIVLLERLRGQLPPDDEGLLRRALANDWAHHRKMARRVTFVEARDLLTECELKVGAFGKAPEHPYGEVRVWTDADGDAVAWAEFSAGDPNPPEIRVLGSVFRGDDAAILKDVCLHRSEASESPED